MNHKTDPRMVTFCGKKDYQLALVTPGRRPARALSRNVSLEHLNLRKKPRPRPVNRHRLRRRTEQVSRRILFKSIFALRRSSSLKLGSITIARSLFRFSQWRLTRISRFFCRATTDNFAMLAPYFLRAGPFCRCFLVGSFLLITYTLPRRRTMTSPLEGTALTDALTFMKGSCYELEIDTMLQTFTPFFPVFLRDARIFQKGKNG